MLGIPACTDLEKYPKLFHWGKYVPYIAGILFNPVFDNSVWCEPPGFILNFLIKNNFFFRERVTQAGERSSGRERETEAQVDSTLTAEPDMEFNPTTARSWP